MDLATFIQQRRPQWRQLEDLLRQVEGSGLRSLDEQQSVDFGRLYRCAASDLNQAQTFVSGDATVQYLNDLVARCYLIIYGKTKADPWGTLLYLVWGYPAVFRRYLRYFLLATAISALGVAFGAVAAWHDADLAQMYLMPEGDRSIQPLKEGEEDPTPVASTGWLVGGSARYFTHNITVSLVCFALGLTFGVGTVLALFENGVLLGVIGVVFANAGQFKSFCAEILPHGVLEFPAILIAGAGGFILAEAMIRAKPWPRLEELARGGKQALLLVTGCFPLMIMAGMLEMGVARAPQRFLGHEFKLAVAGVFAVLFLAYSFLFGWGRKSGPAEGGHAGA